MAVDEMLDEELCMANDKNVPLDLNSEQRLRREKILKKRPYHA